MEPAGSRRSRRRRRASRCPPSRSPTTARWRARSTSTRRRTRRASSRSSAARCTSSTTGASRRRATRISRSWPPTTPATRTSSSSARSAYLEGYYYKPRVDWELLERYAPGLIALSGCLSGRVSRALSEHREDDALAELDRLSQIFGRDSTYVELQNVGLEVQQPAFQRAARPRRAPRAAACRDRRRPLPRRHRRVIVTTRSSASSRATR